MAPGYLVFLFVVLIMPQGPKPIIQEMQVPDLQTCLETVSDLLNKFVEQRMPGRIQASCGVIGPEEERTAK